MKDYKKVKEAFETVLEVLRDMSTEDFQELLNKQKDKQKDKVNGEIIKSSQNTTEYGCFFDCDLGMPHADCVLDSTNSFIGDNCSYCRDEDIASKYNCMYWRPIDNV